MLARQHALSNRAREPVHEHVVQQKNLVIEEMSLEVPGRVLADLPGVGCEIGVYSLPT